MSQISTTPVRKRNPRKKTVSTIPAPPIEIMDVPIPKTKKVKKVPGKKRNPNIGSMGKRIMDHAKEIRAKNPGMAWKSCVSQSAKSLKKS